MKEETATLDSVEVMRHEVANVGAGESPAVPAPAIVATTADIRAGIVLIKADAPQPVRFESKHWGAWKLLTGVDGFQVERRLSEAGWHFFLMVPETRVGALSLNRKRGVRKALKKILSTMETQGFNAVEVVEIKTKHWVGFNSVEVVAYARHAKNSPFLRSLDSYPGSQNAWNFKHILRRRARIGPTRKGI